MNIHNVCSEITLLELLPHLSGSNELTASACFISEELRSMFTQAGLVENQNIVDRRLQVNRGRQLKMYRVWIQCKYSKPLSS